MQPNSITTTAYTLPERRSRQWLSDQ